MNDASMTDAFAAISADKELKSASKTSESLKEQQMYDLGKIELALQENSQNLGFLGKAFGSYRHAPTNIAGLTVIIGFLGIALIIFRELEPATSQSLRELFGGLILAALGYLFGANSNK